MTDFSYQLYSSRKYPPLTDTLKMLAGLGYAQVEGFGALYADPNAVAEIAGGLKDTGLAMPTSHFALDMCRDESERVLAIVKALGIKVVIVPHIAPDQQPKDAAGWRAYGKGLAQVAQRYWDAGLGFGYHNHDFEYVRTDTGELPIDLILEGDPRLGLEFDVAWAARVGFDPMETIKKHGPRIFSAHVKDIAPKGGNADEDGWADIGAGTVAWATLLPALRDAGCTYFVMEHDNPNDHRRFATTGIAAAKAL